MPIIEILQNGVVVESILASPEFMQEHYPGVQFNVVNDVTTHQVPVVVSMRQARLALLEIGKYSQVAAAIAMLPSPDKEKAEIEWQYSNEVQRHNSFVSLLGPGLGLTEQGIDDLFILAKTL